MEPSTKWGAAEKTHTVRFFHDRIRALVAQRAQALKRPWAEIVVQDPLALLSAEDLQGLEDELLATGYRYEPAATVSVQEAPQKYKALGGVTADEQAAVEINGRIEVGSGDNLVQAATALRGIARFISTIDQVFHLLANGVPPDTVAVIDDSGGTLTAPILQHFKAVLCLGGSVRSHLGILTREYGIPCFMNCKLDRALKEGDEVELELTVAATLGEDYETGRNLRARVWKLT
jgi:hypothetical protein